MANIVDSRLTYKIESACIPCDRKRGENRTVLVLGMATSPAELTEMIGEGLKES
jgi:hypothetical protein